MVTVMPLVVTTESRLLVTTALVVFASFSLERGAWAQTELDCRMLDRDISYWRGCRDSSVQITDPYCVGCGMSMPSIPPTRRQYATALTQQDVLLFLAYGLSDRLTTQINDSLWQRQSLTPTPRRQDRESLQPVFSLHWRGDHFEAPQRADLMGYLATVVPAEQLPLAADCDDCEFTMAMGMIWGYRWSTLSGRLSGESGSHELGRAPNYGFSFMHRASPKWRYLLAVGRDDEAVDLLGSAQWRIRPDAYVSFTAGLDERQSLAGSQSDMKLHFSFE